MTPVSLPTRHPDLLHSDPAFGCFVTLFSQVSLPTRARQLPSVPSDPSEVTLATLASLPSRPPVSCLVSQVATVSHVSFSTHACRGSGLPSAPTVPRDLRRSSCTPLPSLSLPHRTNQPCPMHFVPHPNPPIAIQPEPNLNLSSTQQPKWT